MKSDGQFIGFSTKPTLGGAGGEPMHHYRVDSKFVYELCLLVCECVCVCVCYAWTEIMHNFRHKCVIKIALLCICGL